MGNYTEILNLIDPAILSYEEWLKIGQALHYEGEPMTTWQEWSWRDPRRAIETDFEAKWDSFNDNRGDVVTGGTIYHVAEQYGFIKKRSDSVLDLDKTYDWSKINADPDPFEFRIPTKKDTMDFFKSLGLKDEDYICYCRADSFDEVVYSRQLIEVLDNLNKQSFSSTFGTYDEDAGMFVTINPLDGTGRKVKNVTRFMNTLIECDPDKQEFYSLSEAEQKEELFNQIKKIKSLNLPCRAITYSGGKSIHAIVRIDAVNEYQYKQRVVELQEYCRAHGLNVDTANKDASRFSRMPGAKRGNRWQFLIETNSGAPDWEEWRKFIEVKENLEKLPPIQSLADIARNGIAEPPPELIEGMFRAGGKMVVTGKAKAGKTFLLMELGIAIAQGSSWLGHKCMKGKVLYVDLELNAVQSQQRFKKICDKLEINMLDLKNIELWNLRGEGLVGNSLADALISKVTSDKYDLVIIDPLYKMLDGSENDAKDVGDFTRMLDRICKSLNTAICYSHHNKKGGVDGDPIDMSSGSSVIARDADTMIVLTEEKDVFSKIDIMSVKMNCDFQNAICHKVNTIFRDFRSLPDNTYLFFDYPCHYLLEGAEPLNKEEKRTPQNEKAKVAKNTGRRNERIKNIHSYLDDSALPVKISKLAEEFNVDSKTIKRDIEKIEDYMIENGEVYLNTTEQLDFID